MTTMKFQILKITAFAFLLALIAGCSDYLENPLKDEETGDDINLLVVDFNFFDSRLSFKLLDAETGSQITSPATVSFTGENGTDIVNYSGEKKADYITTQGQLELAIDPNITISETSPFQFAVHVKVDGYNDFSKGFQFSNESKKTVELQLSKESDEEETDLDGEINIGDGDTSIVFFAVPEVNLKSALAEEKSYEINYAITISDFLKFKDSNGDYLFNSSAEVIEAYNSDPDNFMTMSISSYSNYDPEIDVVDNGDGPKSVLFQKLETGKLTKLLVTGRTVADLNGGVISSTATYTGKSVPDIFGFAEFGESSWSVIGTETIYETLNFSYTLIEASGETLCETGSSITFQSDVTSSFSIDADVYDADGNLINTMNFKGSFPETFVVENTPQKAVKLVFRNNNPSFQDIPPLSIENFCSGSYNVNVAAETGYEEYQIVLKALCPDNPTIAIAPTYSAEIKVKGSDDPWQGVDMVGGVTDILGLPNQAYELRLLWQNDWEYSTYYTEFDANGNYLHETGSDAVISSKRMQDGRIQINVEQVFNQSVCTDLGW